jgi:hypothetical protein
MARSFPLPRCVQRNKNAYIHACVYACVCVRVCVANLPHFLVAQHKSRGKRKKKRYGTASEDGGIHLPHFFVAQQLGLLGVVLLGF